MLSQGKEKIPTLSGMKYSGFDLAGAVKCMSEHGSEFEIMWGRDDVREIYWAFLNTVIFIPSIIEF